MTHVTRSSPPTPFMFAPGEDLADEILKLVLFGPSGVGKTSVVQRLIERLPDKVCVSTSWTTRARRMGEVDGIHYHFRSYDQYKQVMALRGFVEWAEVHGHYYGTPIDPIREAARKGQRAMLFPIDWQGGEQLARRLRRVTQVMLVPPSLATLEERLRGRGTDDDATITRRLVNAVTELAHFDQAEVILVNDQSERVADQLVRLINGETVPSDCDGTAIERLIAGDTLHVAA